LLPQAATGGGANAINALGQIVGGYNNGGGSGNGFLYSNGNYTTIAPPGSISSVAEAINDTGQIVGVYQVGNVSLSFLYDNGVYTPIVFPGATETIAFHINDAGQIVGIYLSQGAYKGFLYSDGSFTTILGPDLPGLVVQSIFVSGINDAGQIVGYATYVPPVPLPATWLTMMSGLGWLGFMCWRRKKPQAPSPV
jgi:probable HAF family extracellular repeat protein